MFPAVYLAHTNSQPHGIAARCARRARTRRRVAPYISHAGRRAGVQPAEACKRVTAPGAAELGRQRRPGGAGRVSQPNPLRTFPRHLCAFPSSSLAYIANLALSPPHQSSRPVPALTLPVTPPEPLAQARQIARPPYYTCNPPPVLRPLARPARQNFSLQHLHACAAAATACAAPQVTCAQSSPRSPPPLPLHPGSH
jgi:hypothetical protein